MIPDDTTLLPKPKQGREPSLFNLSVRGCVVMLIVITVCAMNLMGKEVVEPLYSVVIATISYYFGQTQRQLPHP
jgi:hypothetical protein